MVPGRGREFGFPGFEVCARHGFGGGVGGEVHEAGGHVGVREEAEEEGEGEGVEGVVWGCGCGGGHGWVCVLGGGCGEDGWLL